MHHFELPLLSVWDRLPVHHSRLARDYIASVRGWILTSYQRPYAPELNPIESIWAYWKRHKLPNVCLRDYWQSNEMPRRTLLRMGRRRRGCPRRISAF